MLTKCPNCGSQNSLDALIVCDEATDALAKAFALSGDLGRSLLRYFGLFRPSKSSLSFARVAKLLDELLPSINARRIERNHQVFDAPVEAWVYGINEMIKARDAGQLKLPIKSHGYLFEVIASYAPTSGVVAITTDSVQPARDRSKTLDAIALLEGAKRGKST